MRTFALASCLAVSQAIKLMDFGGPSFNHMFGDVVSYFDLDGDNDGYLDTKEYIQLLEFLDEDQYLNPREMGEAINMWYEMDFTDNTPTDRDLALWLTNIVSSAAQDDNFGDDTLDVAHFVTLATKLGISEADARDKFSSIDLNGDGVLTLTNQDYLW